MPNVLPTIPNDPPQGIQALLDKVYLWNPDVSNDLIEKVNALLTKLGDAIGAIRPYNELVAPINQYEPCYYGDGVYVAKNYLTERTEEFNEEDWILIARKGLTEEEANEKFLPLSGGAVEGFLDFVDGWSSTRGIRFIPTNNISLATKIGVDQLGTLGISLGPNKGTVHIGNYGGLSATRLTLGAAAEPWSVAYIEKFNNGEDITVPSIGGTLARLEDLTAGNVSITFAGQEDTLQNAIDTLKTDQGELGDQVSAIESKIPADASETNQLVTKNEVLALPTFTYTVVNELPETGEEKIIYLVPKAGEGNDVHDEYIWVNGGYELIGTTAVDLGDYLPLSGGTLTGELTIDAGETTGEYNYKPILTLKTTRPSGTINKTVISSTASGLDFGGAYISRVGDIVPSTNYATLGNAGTYWNRLYVAEIANGTNPNIKVPTKGGTFALAEDIAESVTTKDLTVGTEEGTLNIGIAAGTATIATNNGLDIVSPTKFDTAPTTDDATAWADVNATAFVTKAQVSTALSTAGGRTTVTIRNWA